MQGLFEAPGLLAFAAGLGSPGRGIAFGVGGASLSQIEAAALLSEGVPADTDGVCAKNQKPAEKDQKRRTFDRGQKRKRARPPRLRGDHG